MITSISVRYYVFEEDGEIRRMPSTVFRHCTDGKIPLLRYAGQRVRFLEVLYETILRIQTGRARRAYFVVHFDESGFVSREKQREAMRLSVDSMSWREENSQSALEARRELMEEFSWTPTDRELDGIDDLR